jgi:hypothetical protein
VPRSRPPYPEDFRREAVELVRTSGRSIPEIAVSQLNNVGTCRGLSGILNAAEGLQPS